MSGGESGDIRSSDKEIKRATSHALKPGMGNRGCQRGRCGKKMQLLQI